MTPEPAARERKLLRATQQQAWGTMLSAVASGTALAFTIVAVVISFAAWSGQRELNRQQVQLNTYAQKSQQEVYSAKVAMWAAVGTTSSSVLPDGLDVWVQNRAPVPIHNVSIVATLTSGASAHTLLGDIPPCTTESLRVAPPPGESLVKTPQEWLGYTKLMLTFVETNRAWILTSDSLTESAPASEASGPQMRQAAAVQRSVDGCG